MFEVYFKGYRVVCSSVEEVAALTGLTADTSAKPKTVGGNAASTTKVVRNTRSKAPKAIKVELKLKGDSGKLVEFSKMPRPAYLFLKEQAMTIDAKAVYDRSEKAFGFSTKTAANKFVKGFNGHEVTVEEQTKALAKFTK